MCCQDQEPVLSGIESGQRDRSKEHNALLGSEPNCLPLVVGLAKDEPPFLQDVVTRSGRGILRRGIERGAAERPVSVRSATENAG